MRTLVGVALASVLTFGQEPAPPRIVVAVRVLFNGNSFGVSLDRPFGLVPIACQWPSGGQPRNISEILGPTVKALTVAAYATPRFQSETQLSAYIRSMLVARPEGGSLGTGVWSEGTDLDIGIVTEWADGRFGRFDLGTNGRTRYAHVQDHRGCEWWGRFLAPK